MGRISRLACIGEIFAATRADLVLPSDVQRTIGYLLLALGRGPRFGGGAVAQCRHHGYMYVYIYTHIQAVSSVLFLSKLHRHVARETLEVMRFFPALLDQAEVYEKRGYPPRTWVSLSAVGQAIGPHSLDQMGGGKEC